MILDYTLNICNINYKYNNQCKWSYLAASCNIKKPMLTCKPQHYSLMYISYVHAIYMKLTQYKIKISIWVSVPYHEYTTVMTLGSAHTKMTKNHLHKLK